jgi:hypothetical protein
MTPLAVYPDAEFLDIIGTKVLRVLLLAIHSYFYYLIFRWRGGP